MTKDDRQESQQELDEIGALIAAGSPGIETVLQQFEGAERVYYGAVTATTVPEVVITSATTPFPVEADPA